MDSQSEIFDKNNTIVLPYFGKISKTIYVNGGGNKNKRGRKKEEEGRGFQRLPAFFFPPFLFVFLTVSFFFLIVLLRCVDFGPNLVVFFVF